MGKGLVGLDGRKVLITGGCGAIGRVVVRELCEEGAIVSVVDVVSEDEARESLGADLYGSDRCTYFKVDVTDPDEVKSLFDRQDAKYGSVDVVACHVGVAGSAPIEKYSLKDFDFMMNVNLRSTFIVAQEAARRWKERGQPGHLIFTTSWVQDVPWPEIGPYSASKAATKSLMRTFARELAPHGIRSNAIAPGIVGVGMAKRQWDTDPSYRARAEKAIPLGYLQTPESVAHAFLFLCSDLASYMTGSVLLVDGGCSLYPMD